MLRDSGVRVAGDRLELLQSTFFTVAPVAYQVILEPGRGQFREFEPRRVHTRINSWGLFRVHQIDLRKARERELATLDEKSTSIGIAEHYAL